MKKSQLHSLIKEVIKEEIHNMGRQPMTPEINPDMQDIKEMGSPGSFDPDINLYRWIQMRLRRETNYKNTEALRQVAAMIEKEKGHMLKDLPPTSRVSGM